MSTRFTIALAAGVPMELVRRVTGHKATEVVLMNYFKPGREEFSIAINDEGGGPRDLRHHDAEDVEARHAPRRGPDHANVAGPAARDHPRRIDCGRLIGAGSQRRMRIHWLPVAQTVSDRYVTADIL
jgi:hypothetical protein